MQNSAKQLRKGFTLIEILIAVAIVGLMLAVVGPAVYRRLAGATEDAAKSQINAFKNSIGMYYIDLKTYPNRLIELIKKPTDPNLASKWKGGYLGEGEEEVPLDPWNNPYQYKRTPGGPHPYELYSFGENGQVHLNQNGSVSGKNSYAIQRLYITRNNYRRGHNWNYGHHHHS